MTYILASDYDGTLNQGGKISQRTLDAIGRFRKAGHLFGVVTGREAASWREILAKGLVCETDFNIVANGAHCMDGKGETIFTAPFRANAPYGDTTLEKALIRRYFELGFVAGGLSFERERMDFAMHLPQGGRDGHTVYLPKDDFGDHHEAIIANAYWATLQEADHAAAVLRREFGAYLSPAQNGRYLDITGVGIDKAAGLKTYAERMQVPLANIWTVGDNLNDIPMLRAYHGCAIRSGPVSGLGVADILCDEVADVVDLLLSR